MGKGDDKHGDGKVDRGMRDDRSLSIGTTQKGKGDDNHDNRKIDQDIDTRDDRSLSIGTTQTGTGGDNHSNGKIDTGTRDSTSLAMVTT